MEKAHKESAPDLDFDAIQLDLMRRMQTANTNSWSVEKQATVGAVRR